MNGSPKSEDANRGGAEVLVPYAPPTLSPIGNVRDLLASGNGSVFDGDDPPNDRQFGV